METSPPLPPFLIKTYDMVDDSSTDVIVSWSPACRNSFVVWDFYEFSRALLPRFFKHSNFSSFVRQLNTYGFKKADPDRWEFSHDEFVRGQRHRLKNIRRKKPVATAGSSTLAAVVPHAQGGSADVGAHPPLNGWSTPVGHHHQHHHQQSARQAENEVEQLRRERNVIMLELNRLGGQHHSAHQQIKYMSDRLQAMEMRQQQIVAFVARTMCSPHFLYQYVNQAVAVDHSRAQQKALEDCKEDSSSSGTWKRRRITFADCDGGSSTGMIAGCSDYNQLQMQEQLVEEHASSCRMQEQFAEEHATSCKMNCGTPTPTTISTTSDEQESAASYDQKLMVQLNLESVVNSNLCLDSLIQGGDNHAANHNLACQNRGNNRDVTGAATTTSGGMLEDVKMKMKMKMKDPICEGYALSLEGEDHLQMVDLNLQPFGNMADSFPFQPSNGRIGNGDGGSPEVKYMQANASNTYFEDLESELFWEHLLWPVTMQGEFNGTRSAPGFVNCYGLNE